MSELSVVIALLGGMVIGGFFFGGLWLTIRQVQTARHPARMLLTSSFVRMGIALGGLYVVAWGRWERLLIAVFGFMLARVVVVRLLGYPIAAPQRAEEHSAPWN
ncbi:MAG: ATP synthase subunit I [Chloroflexi bacterium]|nr:ATP synthase subunit I [Chloroflexota bacterium]